MASVLAVSLTGAPIGYALALERSQDAANETREAYEERTGNKLDEAAVIEAAHEADIKGASELEAYLTGETVSEEDVLAIDVEALSEFAPDVADEVANLQERILSGDSAEPAPGDDENASDQDGETPGGDEGEGVPGEDDGAPDDGEDSSDEGTPGEDEGASDEGEDPSAGEGDGTDAPDEPEPGDSDEEGGEAVPPAIEEGQPADPADDGYVSPYPEWSYEGDTTYSSLTYSADVSTEKFIAVIGEQARAIAQENDLYASVMIAQAILESGSGSSSLSQAPNYNLFGIKGASNGRSVVMRTAEDDGTGNLFYLGARFRAYDSVQESLMDYADLLTEGMSGFYAPAWKSNAETAAEACEYLEGRYATDTSYAEKLQALIDTYDLTRYDEPLPYETVDTYTVPVIDEATGQAVLDGETGDVVTEERDLTDLVAELASHLGDPYVYGAAAPGAFDCSGLVQYSYHEALGVDLPRTTYFMALEGEDVDFSDLHMGDLLFFTNEENEAGHVAVYLGEGCYIEAPHEGSVVQVTSMDEAMPVFAKRIVKTRPVGAEAVAVEEAKPAVYKAPLVEVEKNVGQNSKPVPFGALFDVLVLNGLTDAGYDMNRFTGYEDMKKWVDFELSPEIWTR